MNDLNRATIMGNLTRDPEIRQTPNGKTVASFGVATNRRWNNAAGERQDEVEFHDVVAWGKLAEICSQILYKGRKAYIEGRLQTHSWEGQDGVKRSRTEIIADNVIAVGPPRDGAGAGPSTSPPREYSGQVGTSSYQAPSASVSKQVEEVNKVDKNDKVDKVAKTETEKKPSKKANEDEEEINLDDIPF